MVTSLVTSALTSACVRFFYQKHWQDKTTPPSDKHEPAEQALASTSGATMDKKEILKERAILLPPWYLRWLLRCIWLCIWNTVWNTIPNTTTQYYINIWHIFDCWCLGPGFLSPCMFDFKPYMFSMITWLLVLKTWCLCQCNCQCIVVPRQIPKQHLPIWHQHWHQCGISLCSFFYQKHWQDKTTLPSDKQEPAEQTLGSTSGAQSGAPMDKKEKAILLPLWYSSWHSPWYLTCIWNIFWNKFDCWDLGQGFLGPCMCGFKPYTCF